MFASILSYLMLSFCSNKQKMVAAVGGGSVDAHLGVPSSYSFDHNQHSDDDDYKAKCASSPYL